MFQAPGMPDELFECAAPVTAAGVREHPSACLPVSTARRRPLGRDDLGFLLAKAVQRWNELLAGALRRCRLRRRPSLLRLRPTAPVRRGRPAHRRARPSRAAEQANDDRVVGRLERDSLVERRADPGGRSRVVDLPDRAQCGGSRLLPPRVLQSVGRCRSLATEPWCGCQPREIVARADHARSARRLA